MDDVKFEYLASALMVPSLKAVGSALQVAVAPEPFVPPVFQHMAGAPLGQGQVILIRASAAVGKSTLGRALSAAREIPILDLATIPVATGSLVGILNHFRGASDPVDAFHEAKLPIIVDALDEGRLLSGDNGLLSFVQTSAELILQDQRHRQPKLVMLGRPEAIAYADLYLTDAGVETTTLEVGFFNEEGARQLVHAYAQKSAKDDSLYRVHRKPADDLISTYFDKIAVALGLSTANLWTNLSGRSFAGYAPVLAAIGTLIPEIDNYQEAQNRLDQVGTDSAWGVIESVLGSITLRDQTKVVNLLTQARFSGPTEEVFSPQEQCALLLQKVQKLPLSGTGLLRLSGADAAKYADQVQRWLPEHPFLKDHAVFSNDVIASYVLAAAILHGWLIKDDLLLQKLARQPFLWRSLKSTLGGETLIDGAFLGLILSSFWNDPMTVDETVVIRDLDDGGGSMVEIALRGEAMSFVATTPLHFYGQMRNVNVETREAITLVGLGDGPARIFVLGGKNNVTGSVIDLRATELRLRGGSTWLDAEVVPFSGQFKLVITPDTQYGWSDKLAATYPFSDHPSTITIRQAMADKVVNLLSDCAIRAPAGTSIAVFADYTVPENDYLRGVFSKYDVAFCDMISILVDTGFAQTQPIQAAGPPKVRVRLKVPFCDLRNAARDGTSDRELTACIAALRMKIF